MGQRSRREALYPRYSDLTDKGAWTSVPHTQTPTGSLQGVPYGIFADRTCSLRSKRSSQSCLPSIPVVPLCIPLSFDDRSDIRVGFG
jgi:hypothetical protein